MSKKRSEFSAPKNVDLRNRCEVFKMVALNEDDQKFLSHLYRTIFIHGGTVVIKSDEHEAYHFGEPTQ